MKPSLLIAFAAVFAAACANDVPTLGEEGVEFLPEDQAGAPIQLNLQAEHFALRGGQYILRVSGAPARQNLNLVYSTNAGPPYACPAALAPECLSIGGPITLITTRRTDAQGRVQFTLNVPANPPFNTVHFQVAGRIGGQVYATDAVSVALLNPVGDADGDGIPNNEEGNFGTDPLNNDTDSDGLHDGDELTFGSDPTLADTDSDGLSDGDEFILGSNPAAADSDGDGISDADEYYVYNTDPTMADTDADGLTDGDELFLYFTDPNSDDSDNDGLFDGEETLAYGTNAADADTDDDGLSDGEEIILYGTDPLDIDTDVDGLDDFSELVLGTDPLVADSDSDNLNDGAEVYTHNTNPMLADTDAGGENDGDEIVAGRDPLNAADDFGGGGGIGPRVLITEVVDHATLTNARYVELYNSGDADFDLTGYRIARYSNGGTTATNITLTSGLLAPGQFWVVATTNSTANGFDFAFARAASQYSGNINGNGDDVYAFADAAGTVIDVFGEIGIDGTGTAWDYEDDVAQRNAGVVAPSATFNVVEWTVTPGSASANPFAR